MRIGRNCYDRHKSESLPLSQNGSRMTWMSITMSMMVRRPGGHRPGRSPPDKAGRDATTGRGPDRGRGVGASSAGPPRSPTRQTGGKTQRGRTVVPAPPASPPHGRPNPLPGEPPRRPGTVAGRPAHQLVGKRAQPGTRPAIRAHPTPKDQPVKQPPPTTRYSRRPTRRPARGRRGRSHGGEGRTRKADEVCARSERHGW